MQKIVLALGMAFVMILVLTLPTMLAWNCVMPHLFGLKEIGFWHSLSLNILGSVLFKSTSKGK